MITVIDDTFSIIVEYILYIINFMPQAICCLLLHQRMFFMITCFCMS